MTRRIWLAIVLMIPTVAARAQGPRPGEARDLRRKVEANLVEELTRRWYPRSLDPDGGRASTRPSPATGRPCPTTNRSLVYQARMTWTAAAFARHSPAHRDEYAGYARRGVEYLDRVMRDGRVGRLPLGRSGRTARSTPALGDEKHVYGTAFALYAASTRPRGRPATTLALKVARDAFDWLERHAHDAEHGGYFEALTPRRHADPDLGPSRAPLDSGPTAWASITASSR